MKRCADLGIPELDVCFWPIASQIDVGFHVSNWGQSGRAAGIAKATRMTRSGH